MIRLFIFVAILTIPYISAKSQTDIDLGQAILLTHKIVVLSRSAHIGDVITPAEIVGVGTGFTIKYKGKCYFITAKHVFNNKFKSGDFTNIYFADKGTLISLRQVFFIDTRPASDVAVIPIDETQFYTEINGDETITIQDDVLYLGFPESMWGKSPTSTTSVTQDGRIYAIVKRGYVAGMVLSPESDMKYIIDSQCLPGFSGGPVFKKKENKYSLIGLIIGGLTDNIHYIDSLGTPLVNHDVVYQTSLTYVTPVSYILKIIASIQ